MAEEKTIIIKNSEEEKKSNFTFKNYLTSIKIYRYWVLGVSLLIAVFAYLITALGINKSLSKVSSTFSYSFETQSYFGSDAKLLDGSTISINSIVGADTIRSVYENTLDEEGNKVFAKLNLEDIMEDSNIALTKEKDEENIERKETDPVSVDTFILTANIKPFKTESNAKLFAKELTLCPICVRLCSQPESAVRNEFVSCALICLLAAFIACPRAAVLMVRSNDTLPTVVVPSGTFTHLPFL